MGYNGVPIGLIGDPLFFGSVGEGHFTYRSADGGMRRELGLTGSWARWLMYSDGRFPPMPDKDGASALHVIAERVTILAWWDRSGDKRPNSNSLIAADGVHSFEEMVALLVKYFPAVKQRKPLKRQFVAP